MLIPEFCIIISRSYDFLIIYTFTKKSKKVCANVFFVKAGHPRKLYHRTELAIDAQNRMIEASYPDGGYSTITPMAE